MSDIQIFINGKIFTSDGRRPWADAMIAEDGKIVWIGSGKELPDRKGQVTDLKGRRRDSRFCGCPYAPGDAGGFPEKDRCDAPRDTVAEGFGGGGSGLPRKAGPGTVDPGLGI